MPHWSNSTIFYQIYPLGLTGAPPRNDFSSPPVPRLEEVHGWLDHIQALGANALYLGPLFESGSHGYDTADYYWVDRRLGTHDTLRCLSADLHARGMRLVLDGVFNHVGREFWAFRDVLALGEGSAYTGWFSGLRFDQRSPFNDPFSYESWNGHPSLVKLNLSNPAVREHLFQAVESWMRDYAIDGLRLDAADCLDFAFLRELGDFCRRLRPDFWLMGEVIHGNYNDWANANTLDSVTNYECYKGLYSSFTERNLFEIAYALERQSGPNGIYRGLQLYTFADNHDVNRVASQLALPAQLYPLYCLLFSMPGVPSIYYGSEWGLTGKKGAYSDQPLRPRLVLQEIEHSAPQPDLPAVLSRLARIRSRSAALQRGDYHQLHVNHGQLVFSRQADGETVIVAINAADKPVQVRVRLPNGPRKRLMDLLNPGDEIKVEGEEAVLNLQPCWARILSNTME